MNRNTVFLLMTLIVLIAFDASNNTISVTKCNKTFYKTFSSSRIKRVKSRVSYYSNSDATFNIILSGDIECIPGPAPKCTECNKGVGTNRKRFICEVCMSLTHLSCSSIPVALHKSYNSRAAYTWTCKNCIITTLPFFHSNSIFFEDIDEDVHVPIDNTERNHHLETLQNHRKMTSIAHINTQSLLSSFDEFRTMLLTHEFDIITLNETWLTDNKKQLDYVSDIPGYAEPTFRHRQNQRGGGVGFYVRENIKFKVRLDLTKKYNLEALCLEFQGRNKNNAYLVLTVYQPSSKEADKLTWLSEFESMLSDILTKWTGIVFVTGDTNIDLLCGEKESQRRYKEILSCYNLSQLVTKPTRKRKTLIDHISTNIPNKLIVTDVLQTDEISDHDTPYAIMNVKKEKFEPRYKYIRDEKNFNLENFKHEFSQLPFNLSFAFDDPDDKLDILNKLILSCINHHAPIKRVKITRPIAPWMKDPRIVEAYRNLNTARTQYAHLTDKTLYKAQKKLYKKTIKEVKHSFFRKVLSDKDSKKVWESVNKFLNSQHRRINHHPSDMNNYFSNLVSNLTSKENKQCDFESILNNLPKDKRENEFRINHTTYEEVEKIIHELKNDCSSGYDNIPIRLIKPVSQYIISPIVDIINTSIDSKTFPKQWKRARVCPVPKIDNPTKLKDYRPISILPVMSKIYERVILKQLCSYIETNNLYCSTQSGFRKGHSTSTLLLKLRDDITKAMKKSEITLTILIDFSKAFDTIDHGVLLEKLYQLNFSRNAIEILSNYLRDRDQYVQIDDQISNYSPMNFGVPQGSILGPVLFNLYVIELTKDISAKSIQYADDTTIYRHCKIVEIKDSIKELENDIEDLLVWSRNHNLLFNSDKLQFIIFVSSRLSKKLGLDRSYLIRSSGKSIEQKRNAKLLGILFDENLSWNDQINRLIKSSHGTLRALRKFGRFTPYHVRKSLAEALILSKLNYGSTVFAQIPNYMVQRLQKVQNITAAYVLSRYATTKDVIELEWLPMKELFQWNTAKLVHKSKFDSKHPDYLKVEFHTPKSVRSEKQEPFVAPGVTKTFQAQAKLFDELPEKLKNIKEYKNFSKESKIFYLDQALAKSLS